MRTTMNRNRAIFSYGTLLILLLQIPAYFLLRQDAEGLLLYIFFNDPHTTYPLERDRIWAC